MILQLMERWRNVQGDIESHGAKTLNEDSRRTCLAGQADPHGVGGQTGPRVLPFKQSRRAIDDESVREDIVKLREKMLHVESMQRELENEDVTRQPFDVSVFDQRIGVLKRILSSLDELRSSLLEVKVKVHRLAASYCDAPVNEHVSLLTQEVRDLHNTWHTLRERTAHQLRELQQSKSVLQGLYQNRNLLKNALNQPNETVALATTNGKISGHSQLTPCICPRSSTLLSLNDDDYDSNYESEEESPTTCSGGDGKKSIWRIFKAALPFQVALVMLYCVACFMEPRCCDVANTLNSFGPQLRYEQGPPPI
ncbi:hypothetical protein BIW11_02900 [Tropilaelaps mercedesae]|uniref:KASH domain-containing protein n=1 Tax=Tropilaelaps mercedesae TaxID=418985 RepID=A0A1V9XVH1_9ACAR|nr:hypothetical protein BIW11_02900 [Tropilaelaps mercedesae]